MVLVVKKKKQKTTTTTTCQFRRHKKRGFDPWVREILWRRAWQPTLVFLPGESHGQRCLVGYTVYGVTESQI